MNLNDLKEKVQMSIGRGSLTVQKYSPEILLGVGLVGVVATVVMASKATLKAQKIVDTMNVDLEQIEKVNDHREMTDSDIEYTNEDYMKDKAIVYVQTGIKFARLYGPAASVGLLSIMAILASHGVMKNRQVALIAAYNLLKEGYDNYRARVVEDLGEDTDRNYFLGLKDETHTEKVVNEDGTTSKTKVTTKTSYDHNVKSIYSRFFDESNPMFRSDRTLNKAFLQAQQNYMNDCLIIRGHLFLNEVYEALGFPHTKEGAIVGWVLKSEKKMAEEGRSGFVDFGMYDVYNDPGREFVNGTNPTILLDFNVDGIIFDLI